uniref:Eukaryotic translation initiation factor 5A n=1 Tax=Chromera velia CCMP2878 TaxID=1169474 RepID=A0A0G4H2U3_9ALVE|mmetsp:Transcript_25386/g.49591  ORF Transcript_25386/g.49591 Transcript_25386/m.49591 type:complete len:164 (+) Transcript_25386:114-605(+)|eukprot:Cvel_5618.t1-p1 / transcript=Cvel_5618.t1 / gene=Cvel_5618 / organism=Chromera_velia_CCMP2878 / gene_product=Eukaryotic translation initiation factor 5A-3, putative / transcript_product=Eukaryotic translation initiation factor 5A-3, putative / location=Cvel_scaffold264:96318-96806(-) / protein_length=163 / sequence_SO=supercontig / SO=protein_coding / is_pseudo=false
MADDGALEVEVAGAGASHTTNDTANNVQKGAYIMLKGKPCKVVDYSKAKPGKHGAAKIMFVGIDIFTDKKVEETHSSTSNVEVPIVKKSEFQLMDITDEGYMSLIDGSGNMKEDVKIPDASEDDQKLVAEMKGGLDSGKQVVVSVISAMGLERVVGPLKITDA